jgi:anti-sigma B factor antagonist
MEGITSAFTKLNSLNTGITLEAGSMDGAKKTLVISIKGSLNTDNSIPFSECLASIVEGGCDYPRIVFDLTGLTYASSAGIGAMVSFLQQTKAENVELVLCNVDEKVLGVMETLGFAAFFTIVPGIGDVG